jgi:hypothetical protein
MSSGSSSSSSSDKIDAQTRERMGTELLGAVVADNSQLIRDLVAAGVDINYCDMMV